MISDDSAGSLLKTVLLLHFDFLADCNETQGSMLMARGVACQGCCDDLTILLKGDAEAKLTWADDPDHSFILFQPPSLGKDV